MGYQLIKCGPDTDLYMEWCSIGEEPVAAGTRAQTLDYLNGIAHPAGNPPEFRLERADAHGTSMLAGPGADWNSNGLIYQQRGFLPRARFAAFARRFISDDEPGMIALLEPLDGETEVRT